MALTLILLHPIRRFSISYKTLPIMHPIATCKYQILSNQRGPYSRGVSLLRARLANLVVMSHDFQGEVDHGPTSLKYMGCDKSDRQFLHLYCKYGRG